MLKIVYTKLISVMLLMLYAFSAQVCIKHIHCNTSNIVCTEVVSIDNLEHKAGCSCCSSYEEGVELDFYKALSQATNDHLNGGDCGCSHCNVTVDHVGSALNMYFVNNFELSKLFTAQIIVSDTICHSGYYTQISHCLFDLPIPEGNYVEGVDVRGPPVVVS